MGVHTLRDGGQACMYCSTSGWAFGPVFSDSDTHDADERIDSFLRWMEKTGKKDPRQYTDNELESLHSEWWHQEDAQWEAEEKVEEINSH